MQCDHLVPCFEQGHCGWGFSCYFVSSSYRTALAQQHQTVLELYSSVRENEQQTNWLHRSGK